MKQDELKKQLGYKAIEFVEKNTVIGVGTGTTVYYFIEALSTIKNDIIGAVSSSEQSTKLLQEVGIPVFDVNTIDYLAVYIDGADEINTNLAMIKGGGGALTREKILATMAKKFICIADSSKYVDTLGTFPLPIEVLPFARSVVSQKVMTMGGLPKYRENMMTDNGCQIIDVHQWNITEPEKLEVELNNIPGVLTNGLFSLRKADVLLLNSASCGIEIIK